MFDLGQPVVRWIDRNMTTITKNALLQNHMVGWGGRFEYGKAVPMGTAVLYLDKVMYATSDTQADIPEEGAKGFEMLVDLRNMRVADDPFIHARTAITTSDKSRETVLTGCAVRYAIKKITHKLYNSDIEGVYKWRGIFQSDSSYGKGELVAYKGFIYQAIDASGYPGVSEGWDQLDGRSRSAGIAVTTNYVIDDDGNFVIDENGLYVVAD